MDIRGGSELANTQSSVDDLCALLGGAAFRESQFNARQNDHVIELFRVIALGVRTQRSKPGAGTYLAQSLAVENADKTAV